MLAPDGASILLVPTLLKASPLSAVGKSLCTPNTFPPLLVLEMAVSTQKHSAFISAISTPATRPLRM
jgi:hypothetical protein